MLLLLLLLLLLSALLLLLLLLLSALLVVLLTSDPFPVVAVTDIAVVAVAEVADAGAAADAAPVPDVAVVANVADAGVVSARAQVLRHDGALGRERGGERQEPGDDLLGTGLPHREDGQGQDGLRVRRFARLLRTKFPVLCVLVFKGV